MKTLLLFLGNLIPISTLLAIFEIWLEGFKAGPWGQTVFASPWWEKRIERSESAPKSLKEKIKYIFIDGILRITEKDYFCRYHVVLFGGIIPAITMINYVVLWCMSGNVWSIHGLLLMTIAGTKIFTPLFIVAVWIGNLVLEDFLWFAIQSLTGWREPHALRRLLHGDFAWHKKWWTFFGLSVPRFYVTTPMIVAVLLIAQWAVALAFR